jgi:PAS domain S-box-containing protein
VRSGLLPEFAVFAALDGVTSQESGFMSITIILGVSITLQFIAACVSLSLARTTGFRKAWLAIAGAVLLMAVPRTITFVRLVRGDIAQPPNLESELVALDISFLMGIGLAWIAQLFRSLQKSHRELMKSQQELIESEHRLKILFENAPDAIFVLDVMGTFTEGNRAAESITGLSREDLIGSTLFDPEFFSEEDLEHARGAMEKCATGATIGPEEFTMNRPDGSVVIIEVRAYPISLNDHQVVLAIARDVTERKKADREREKLEEQLRRSQKMETIGTLAGGIAHDFNNILTPILGYTDMAMAETEVTGNTRADLEQVIQAAHRAKELVQQILLFGRQGDEERKPVRLRLIVKEALKLLRASLPASIEIRVNVTDTCGPVLADASQMHQVLMNLCTNAYHSMRERGGVLDITLDPVEVNEEFARQNANLHPGTYLRLAVSDTGHGMDRVTMERIFEPFFTTKDPGEGTGLGLSVVHGIIMQHGGEITVSSQVGIGTVFQIYLPQVTEDAPELSMQDGHVPGGHERVLFVDDEEEIVRMGAKMLLKLGYKVTARTSSVDALDVFRERACEFDLVITDQNMPRMTGAALAREMIRIRPDIPIILMTGYSETVTTENFRHLGISDYLMKPLSARDLGRAIRGVLDEAKEFES